MAEPGRGPGRPRKYPLEDGSTDSPPTRISVINRRLKNPFGLPSGGIPLKGPRARWVCRWFTADAEHEDRHYQAVHYQGWVPLTIDDIAVKPEVLGALVSSDGHITRGAKGQDVLMAMPARDWEELQQAKSDANIKGMKPAKLRETVAEAAAKENGPEAGEMVARNYSQTDTFEPVP